jgi:hypothetical protein
MPLPVVYASMVSIEPIVRSPISSLFFIVTASNGPLVFCSVNAVLNHVQFAVGNNRINMSEKKSVNPVKYF